MEGIDEVIMDLDIASEAVTWIGLFQRIKTSKLYAIKIIDKRRCGRGLS